MNYIRFFLFSFFIVFSCIKPTQPIATDVPVNPEEPTLAKEKGEMPGLEQLEKELQETTKAIDDYVATLSPEEQDEFNKAVEEVTTMIEGMDEDEFSQFLEEAFGEELPLEEPTEPEEVEVEEKVITPEEKLTKEEKEKQAQVLSLIDTIITHTNSFIVKIVSSPGISNKIEQWGTEGLITEWPTDLKLKNFKLQLEEFVQKLYRTKDIDLQTKKHKYIAELIKDKELYDNLVQLKMKIVTYEPNIEVPEFGLEKLSTESKKAIQKLTSIYTKALYINKMPQALEKLFEKYEPTAKKLRAEEETAEKKARKEAQKKLSTERPIIAGKEDIGRIGLRQPTMPTYKPSPVYTPTTQPSLPKKEKIDQKTPEIEPDKKGPKQGKTPKRGKIKEKKDVDTVITTVNPESERMLGKIEVNLQDAASMIEKNEKLKNIDNHIVANEEPVDRVLAIIEIPSLKRKLTETTSDIKALNLKNQSLASGTKKHYKNMLQDTFNQFKKELSGLLSTIQNIEKNIETDSENFLNQISDEKKYAYLEDDQAIERIEEKTKGMSTIKDEIPHPVSLTKLKNAIKDLFKSVEDFSTKKK